MFYHINLFKEELFLYFIVDVEVPQDSELGHLGLCALVARGFCGPPYDLSVGFTRHDTGLICIDFYDMSTSVAPDSKNYQRMSDLFSAEQTVSKE